MHILITGATSGIGAQTADRLAALGHTIGVHGRSQDKVAERITAIEAAGGAAHGFVADLTSLDAVNQLASEVLSGWGRLDVLINNAGLVETARHVTDDGFERTWAVNHLAHHLLTQRLADRVASSDGRVVCVASDAHFGCKIPWDDLNAETRFSGWSRYQQTKLMNVLFARELARRRTDLTSVSLHPGFVASNFGMNAGWMSWVMRLTRLVQRSVDDGAKTSVWCAVADDLSPGAYYAKETEKTPSKAAQNDHDAERLWTETEAQLAPWLGDAQR